MGSNKVIFIFLVAFLSFEVSPKSDSNIDMYFINKKNEILNIISENITPDIKKEDKEIISDTLLSQCILHNIPPNLVLSIIRVESSFKVDAESSVGARGLMQLMPKTAKYIASRFAHPYNNKKELFDAKTNITLGIHYLSYLLIKYNKNLDLTLAAYNAGPTKVNNLTKKYGKKGYTRIKGVSDYVRNVKKYTYINKNTKLYSLL